MGRSRSRNAYDREIGRLAVPALGALAAEPLYVLVDTAVVGHLGTSQLGGLAVAASILTTGFWVFNFLAWGTTMSVARLVGAGDDRSAVRHAIQGLWLALAAGTTLLLAGVFLAGPAVALFGVSGAVRHNAVVYLRISALGAPAVLVALVGVGFLRGMQNTRATLTIALWSNCLNLLLELVLIYGGGFGIGASALATVVAQVTAALAYASIVLRAASRSEASLTPDIYRLRRLVVVAVDLFVRTGALLAALALATAIAARMGAAALAGHQVAFQLWMFLALALDALAIAGQAMVGRLLGAGDAGAARAAASRMLTWGALLGAVFGVTVALTRPLLVPVFTDDPLVRDQLLPVLLVVAVLQPLNSVVFVLDGVLVGAGDLRYLAKSMVVSAGAVFLPASLAVFVLDAGLLALWGALSLLMVARLAANAGRFLGTTWQVTGPVLGTRGSRGA